MSDTTAAIPDREDAPRSLRRDVWDQFRMHRGAMVGLWVLAGLLIFVLIGPLVWTAEPMPFTPNRFSVMMAPPKIDGIPRAITVTTGISELRKTCFRITVRSLIPLARAVRT